MATISKIKPGQVLYTVSRHRMGNTTLKTTAIHSVRVIEVHADHVMASWNGNTPRKYRASEVATWKVNRPVTVGSTFGGTRLATRAEIAAIKAKTA